VWRTFGLSAPLFINSGDFLQIEIYYNKKKFFLSFIKLLKEKELSLFMIWSSRSIFLSQKLCSQEIFLSQKRARARFHFRKALAGASRGGAGLRFLLS